MNCWSAAMPVSEQQATSPVPEAVRLHPKGKTAVLLVNGFNGLGIHTLLNVIRLFEGASRTIVFVQIGVVDVGNFKGPAEVDSLKEHIDVRGETICRLPAASRIIC